MHNWKVAIRCGGNTTFILEFDSYITDAILKESKKMVYYIADYYLNKLASAKDSAALSKPSSLLFAAPHNSLSVQDATSSNLPTTKIDTKDGLRRGSSNLYTFFSVLEALCFFNLNQLIAMKYRGLRWEELQKALRCSATYSYRSI